MVAPLILHSIALELVIDFAEVAASQAVSIDKQACRTTVAPDGAPLATTAGYIDSRDLQQVAGLALVVLPGITCFDVECRPLRRASRYGSQQEG